MNFYVFAREVTDEVFGHGTYAETNGLDHPDPKVREQAEISKRNGEIMDPKLEVMMALVTMNEQVNKAVEEFVNPDNLLELPAELRVAIQEFSTARTKLAEATITWMDRR
jgi:hypothetical protein